MKLYMLRGLPASGKTTYARQLVSKGAKRVSKDDLRAMLDFGKFSKDDENFIRNIRNLIIGHALLENYDVVVDDTNLNPEHEILLCSLAETYGAEFNIIDLNTPIDECIKRDARRQKSVGKDVIIEMADKYLNEKAEAA